MSLISAALGLAILLIAGDLLVRGAVNLSLRLGVPALIVSLTVVAFGTSAPELLIAVQAIRDEAPDLALGNVVGSNTANILLVLGLPALVAGLGTSGHDTRKSYVTMVIVSAIFVAVAFLGPISWVHGLIFLGLLAVILGDQMREAVLHRRAQAATPDEVAAADPKLAGWKIWVFLALGLAGLPLGADILVGAARQIARTYGVSDSVIGLTLVAIGTSLPELATTIVAAMRRQADVALGNAIGSNVFNLLAILGIASFFGPIPVPPDFLRFDLWVMLASAAVIAPVVFSNRHDMNRRWGIALTALYAAYLIVVVKG